MKLLAEGKPTRDIAEELKIGLTTVHTHLRRAREKLGLAGPERLSATRPAISMYRHGQATRI